MLEIKIKGQSLSLSPNTALAFEQFNQLFQKEVGAEGFSYPIDIPTEENKTILGFLDDPQSTTVFKDFECDLTIENKTQRATLSILKASTSKYTCSLFLGLFEKKHLDRPLNELNLGGIREVGNMIAHANSLVDETVETADYTFFPVWDDNFYKISDNESAQSDFQGVINAYFEGSFIAPYDITDDNGTTTINPNTLVPFPYVVYILKQIAKLFNKNLTGSFIADADIKQLVLFNTHDLIGEYPNYTTQINVQNHVPNTTIRSFLNELIVKYNIAVSITAQNLALTFKQDALAALEDDNYTLHTEGEFTLEPFTKKEVQGFLFSSEIDTDDEALTDYADNTAVDGRIKGIVTFKNQLPNPSLLGEFYYVVWHNAFFQSNTNGGDHTTYTEAGGFKNASRYKVGDGGEKIESQSSTLLLEKHLPNIAEHPQIAYYGLCPKTLVPGISVGLAFNTDKKNQFPLKFLFYRGLQPNYDNAAVPLGTNDVWNALNQKVGNLSLQWYGEYGLYERLHKRWVLKLEAAKAINYTIVFDPKHLSNLNFFKPKRLDNQRILLEKINYAIAPDGIQKATVRTLKI
jgi:hypothetical protein